MKDRLGPQNSITILLGTALIPLNTLPRYSQQVIGTIAGSVIIEEIVALLIN